MIYRVMIKTTGSLQPGSGGTFWKRDVIYCGTSLEDARIEYLKAKPSNSFGSYGNRAAEVEIEEFESEPDEIDSEEAEAIEME